MNEDDYEVIVVDDMSTDRSWSVIERFGSLVVPIRMKENLGVSAASNAGIREASGKYVVRVDGDDFINKNFLLSMYEVLKWNDDIGFVYCDHIVVNEDLERRQSLNTLDTLLDHGAGVMFRKRYLESIGLYDENLRNREDYDLILRYIKNFNGYHLRLPYYRHFKRSGSLSSLKDERKIIKNQIDSREK